MKRVATVDWNEGVAVGVWADAKKDYEEKLALKAARDAGTLPPTPIVGGLHYVSATSITGAVPEHAFEKLMKVIDQRFPGRLFEIVSLQTHQTAIGPGQGWTVTALIREVVSTAS